MRKGILKIIFLLLFISFTSSLEGAIFPTLIIRRDDFQIEKLKKWLGSNFPEQEVRILYFETRKAKEILSNLKLDFIPIVVWENFTAYEGWKDLADKFKLVVQNNFAYIPRPILERFAVLELYKRKQIPNRLDVFSMSFCPYSKEAEHRLINYLKINRISNVDLKIRYLVNIKEGKLVSPQGIKELNENRRRIVIQKYWPNKFFDYLLLRDKNSYRKVIRILEIDYSQLKERLTEADELLTQDYRFAKELYIHASPTFLWQNKFLLSNLEQLTLFSPFNKEGKLGKAHLDSQGKIQIIMFFSPKCRVCYKIKDELLPQLISKYKELLKVIYYDIEEPDNFNFLLELEEKFGILERGSIPKIFIGESVLTGAKEIENNLEKIILETLGKEDKGLSSDKVKPQEEIPGRIITLFKSFTPGAVLWAGLVDGINPCAFTTLVFFLSFLSFAGYYKKEVFYIGLFFILSIFLTYFLLGFGVFRFLLKLKIYSLLAEVFYHLVGIIVILLALVNLYEFFRFRKSKNFEDIKLKLPQAIKWRIQAIIGKGYRKEKCKVDKPVSILKLILLSLVIGFIVSIFESVCTGQVYLPTITFITKVSGLRKRAIFYLFIYNLMFILPLVFIFILALYGITSDRFAKFSQKHLGKVKLITALFFFILFILLWKLR